MLKVLIADDEPLVQIGMKSMIDWNTLGIEICGTASNGDTAYEMILKHRPEIVITDIQMPCSSGLDLGKRCMEELGRIPVFIILTSYEDFKYAQEAMRFQAVDYLVKIDLSPDTLTASVKKAIEQVQILQKETLSLEKSSDSLLLFQERFYIRLLNNLFESKEQFIHQSEEFHISMEAAGYAAARITFISNASCHTPSETFQTYQQTLHMFDELLNKYVPCHIIPLDTHYFAVIFLIDQSHITEWTSYLKNALKNTFCMLSDYYNVHFHTSIGRLVAEPLEISTSYYDAKQLSGLLTPEDPLMFWEKATDISSLRNVFNLSLFRNEIVKAFEELNESALRKIMDEIITLLSSDNIHYSQALDVASSILHLSINLLSNGSDIVNEIFVNETDSYRSLYRQKNAASVIKWLQVLETGLCEAFTDDKRCKRHYLVNNCCKYINEHIHERIVLQDIADTFGVSPNYLGQLFKKHMDIGITEYITNQKIAESKRLLKDTNLKIYEISDQLGFESAFYFSKVFKKITGQSPKDFRNV